MRLAAPALFALATAGCHSLLGIEDTVVGGDGDGDSVGLDRVIVAEVRSPQMPSLDPTQPSTGALVLIDFLEEAAPPPIYDDRDARGLGCVVHVRDSISIAHTRNEGEVQITGTSLPIPPCAPHPIDGFRERYTCAELRVSSPASVDLADQPNSRATVTAPGASPPFGPSDVGLFLQIADDPRPARPILADLGGDSVEVFDPFAADAQLEVTQHAVIAGLGPTPPSPRVFEGPVTITKLNGSQTEGFTVQTMAAGATYRLDADSDHPSALPIEGSGGVRFSCSGLNGDCAGGSHVAVWARTTDVRGPPLPLSTELAPIAEAEAELRCLFEGPDVEVPDAAMDALKSALPRRIVMAVLRGSIDVPTNADGSRPTVVFTGFGEYGWTSISNPDDDCDGVFQDCSPGQRCTIITDMPDSGARRCVADGDAELGELCTPRTGQIAGEVDECVAGSGCVFDQCRRTCETVDSPCPDGELCAEFVGDLIDFCLEECDPLDQAGSCDGGVREACYPFNETAICLRPANETFTAAGQPCMFINECQPGTQCSGTVDDPNDRRCRSICDASVCQGADFTCGCGGCAADELCVTGTPGAAVGVCIPDSGIASCDCGMTPPCM